MRREGVTPSPARATHAALAMTTAAIENQAIFFDAARDSIPAPVPRPTRRFVPAAPREKLRFVPGRPTREKLRFVPYAPKKARAAAPTEPRSMMRFGGVGIVAIALVGSVVVTSTAPASSRLPMAEAPAQTDARADVTFATEVPTPVVATPTVVAAPAPARSGVRRATSTISTSAGTSRVRVDENVDELSDEPTVVVPVDGPRPNPF